MLLPFNKPERIKGSQNGNIVLAGDVGATKTNLALFKEEENKLVVLQDVQYKSGSYKNIIELIDSFLKGIATPDSVCLGVAGPVLNGHASLSNIKWKIDRDELSRHLGVKNVHLINDLQATAYGLAMLSEKDIKVIHEAKNVVVGNAAVIAPGTGLGEAGIFWDGKYYHPFATEGGHGDFAARNELDFELYTYLQKQFIHVSWERVVSGPGITNIYQFLRDEKGWNEPGWLKEEITNAEVPKVISAYSDESEICKETMRLFIRYLAHESANLVLKLNATSGLFIGGGIAPQIVPLLENKAFNDSFCQSGRMNHLLENVPVNVLLNSKTALFGAAWYGIYKDS